MKSKKNRRVTPGIAVSITLAPSLTIPLTPSLYFVYDAREALLNSREFFTSKEWDKIVTPTINILTKCVEHNEKRII